MSRQKIKKMMLVGEQKVGKSSIIQYILKGRKFDAEHYPTVGVEAGIKSYEFQSGEFAVVQVWDTAGKHELHDYVCEKFYDDMNGFLIVADMSNQNSLSAAYYWSEKIKKVRQGERGYIVGIVVNKSDVSKPEFTDEDVRRRFPLIKYYGKFSLKEQADPKTKTQVEASLQNFIRDMYENELPRLIVNDSPINNSNCNCSLM